MNLRDDGNEGLKNNNAISENSGVPCLGDAALFSLENPLGHSRNRRDGTSQSLRLLQRRAATSGASQSDFNALQNT